MKKVVNSSNIYLAANVVVAIIVFETIAFSLASIS